MPLYEYECDACGKRFEVICKFSDPALEVCTACGKGPIRRLQSSPAIKFKGSGWYITDYAQKDKSEGRSDKTGKDGGGAEKSDAAAKGDSAGKTEGSPKSDPSTPSTPSSTASTPSTAKDS